MAERRLGHKVYETGVRGYMRLELARFAGLFPPPNYTEEQAAKSDHEMHYMVAFGGLLKRQLGERLYDKMTYEAAERVYCLIAAVDEIGATI